MYLLDRLAFSSPQMFVHLQSIYTTTVDQIFLLYSGHFGTSTVSYFRFLRWLMFLNIFMSVFMLGTVLLPFLLLPPQGHGSFSSSMKNECASTFHWQAVMYSANYTSEVETAVKNSSLGQKFLDVLQGTVSSLQITLSDWNTDNKLF